MLTLLNVKRRNHKVDEGQLVLNTAFISELRVYQTSKSRFRYFMRPEDRRGGYDTFIVSETNAAIVAAMNTAFNATAITLNVYPDEDIQKTPVATVFNVAEIVEVSEYVSDPTKSWVEINWKGFHVKRYLVNHKMVNVPAIAETGTTTTTSTTTTSTTTSGA